MSKEEGKGLAVLFAVAFVIMAAGLIADPKNGPALGNIAEGIASLMFCVICPGAMLLIGAVALLKFISDVVS